MESGLIFLLFLVAAPFLAAAYFLSHRQATKPPTIATNEDLPKTKPTKPTKSAISKTTTKTKSNTTNYSKKKKLAPPNHKRFVGWVKGHTSGIVACSLSPDGQFLAASCEDRTIRVTRMSDCLKIPGQSSNSTSSANGPAMYMSTKTNFTTLTAICWAPSSGGAVIVGVQESDRNVVYYKCKPKKQDNHNNNNSNKPKDTAAEKIKLEEELADEQDIYNVISKKLRNDNYVTNAPKSVIAKERTKMNNSNTNIQRLQESIAILINHQKNDNKKEFKYEIKHLIKKGFSTSCLDTCQYIGIDQSSLSKEPTIITNSFQKSSLRSAQFSLNGTELIAFKTKPGAIQNNTTGYAFTTSNDNKIIAVSLSSSAVGIHKFESSTGMSKKPCMTLSGIHTNVVTDVALGGRASSNNNNDIDRAIVCSQDGTWSLWKIDVQYKFNEEPIMLYHSTPLSKCTTFTKIALSPNGKYLAIAGGNKGNVLTLWKMNNAGIHDSGDVTLMDVIEVGHAEGAITHLQFGPDSTYCCCAANGSKVVYLWSVVVQ